MSEAADSPLPKSPETKSSLSAKEAYDIFASQINKEDALIASRMTWGLTSNGAAVTAFGGLYAFLNSTYVDISPVGRGIALTISLVLLFGISYYVYHNTIESIWDARNQIYHIRKIYHQYWGRQLEALHVPRPYGSRLPHGEHNYTEPQFFALPTIVVPKLLPFARRLHGKRLGRYQFVHTPQYRGHLRERRWWAEKILFAGIATWGVLFLLVFSGLISESFSQRPDRTAGMGAPQSAGAAQTGASTGRKP